MGNRDELSIQELERLIIKHKALYYQGRPELSDIEYDLLEEELRRKSPDSSVLQIVGTILTSLEKVKHDKKMLSLNKTYDQNELKRWMGENEVVGTYKLDGVSCSLIYEHGKLSMAKTRGDGSFGEDITSKIMWMNSIPKKVDFPAGHFLEVRGELYCNEENFFKLSQEMETIKLERPASQRNIVAGLISRKDNLELNRYITFQAFEYLCDQEEPISEMDKFHKLEKMGFQAAEAILHREFSTLTKQLESAEHFMSEGDYQIDGLVFTYNEISLHTQMGETAHHPRYRIAFKFKGESKVTKIEKITWSISRNGVLTPVGIITPVDLSGAKIQRVTLHNYGLVKQYQLKKNDVIKIIRSGEVIPKFLEVEESSNEEFVIPTNCPSCDSPVQIVDIRLVCSNLDCPGRNKESILNFIQKIGIDDLSSKRLDEMIRMQLVKKTSDLYRLKKEDFLGLDKVKEKLATKFEESIEKSKKVSLTTFLSALGISGGAYNKCSKVVDAGFDSIEKIKNLSMEDLCTVESFAEKSAKDFLDSLEEKMPLIDELVSLGFEYNLDKNQRSESSGIFTEKKVCITGALSEKRSAVEARIRDAGGVVVSSVSKNTDYLLTNETNSKSSKYKKALDLGVKIINEDDLRSLNN